MRRSPLRLALLALPPLLAATPVTAQQRGAQQPIAPTGPITLLQAITLGRSQGVNAAIAQLNVGTADARVGQRRRIERFHVHELGRLAQVAAHAAGG